MFLLVRFLRVGFLQFLNYLIVFQCPCMEFTWQMLCPEDKVCNVLRQRPGVKSQNPYTHMGTPTHSHPHMIINPSRNTHSVTHSITSLTHPFTDITDLLTPLTYSHHSLASLIQSHTQSIMSLTQSHRSPTSITRITHSYHLHHSFTSFPGLLIHITHSHQSSHITHITHSHIHVDLQPFLIRWRKWVW